MRNILTGKRLKSEMGPLTRREAIRGMCLAVASTSLIRSSCALEAEHPEFAAIGVNHISYEVTDYAKSRDFYAGLLGMTLRRDTGAQCELTFGDSYIVIRNRTGAVSRIDHAAYTLQNWNRNAVYANLKRHGLNPDEPPHDPDSLMLVDPDGIGVEVGDGNAASPKPPGGSKASGLTATAFHHLSYQVQNYAKTRDFYTSVLGLAPYRDTGKQSNFELGDVRIVVHDRSSATSQIDHVAYAIAGWDRVAVKTQLQARGLDPQPTSDSPDSYMLLDPDGIGVQISPIRTKQDGKSGPS